MDCLNGVHPVDMETQACRKHPDEIIKKFCCICDELVCKICILGLHRYHELTDIENVIDQKKREMSELRFDILQSRIPNLKAIIGTVEQVKGENEREGEKTEESIIQRSIQLKDAIDQITNKCIEETHHVKTSRDETLTKTIKSLENILQDLSLCAKACQIVLSSKNRLQMVQQSKQVKIQSDKIGTSANVPSLKPFQFNPGKLSSKGIDANFGTVSGNVHATPFDHFELISSLKPSKGGINFVIPRINEAWANIEDSNNLSLLDIEGRILSKIEMEMTMEGMAVMANGNLVLSAPEKKAVMMRSTDGCLTKLISMEPLKPWGLCLSQNGDILVCVFEENVTPSKSSRRRAVQRYSITGQLLASMEQEDGINLFSLPYRVRENKHFDIAVVDVISKESARIVGLQQDGTVKFIYDGTRSINPRSRFNPYDVCFDSINNILVADKDSKTVHMLDENGFCLMFCMTYTECFPTCLGSSCDGTIWVGYSNGKLEVWRPKYHALIYHHDE